MSYGIIDIGTNSVLLLIAEYPSPPPLKVRGGGREGVIWATLDEARITRLGEGLHHHKKFLPQAQARTLHVLREYDTLCRSRKVKQVVCVGTAAFRRAENGEEFCREIAEQFGWDCRIISGEEEARLSYLSVEKDFGDRHKNLVALDIGGGSTEIISPNSKTGGVSFDVGTVILTEKFFRHDPPTEGEIKGLMEDVDSKIPPTPLFQSGATLVGLAGTVTTLSSINQKLLSWDPAKIQGSVITMAELEEMISLFRRTNHEERRTIVGMVPGREELILSGALILQAVMQKIGVDRVMVSDRGLRYGVLYDRFS